MASATSVFGRNLQEQVPDEFNLHGDAQQTEIGPGPFTEMPQVLQGRVQQSRAAHSVARDLLSVTGWLSGLYLGSRSKIRMESSKVSRKMHNQAINMKVVFLAIRCCNGWQRHGSQVKVQVRSLQGQAIEL